MFGCTINTVIVTLCLLNFATKISANFFTDNDLIQAVHLDESDVAKLKARYISCVFKFNNMDGNTGNDEIPTYMDIPSYAPFIDLLGNPSASISVTLWPNNEIPTELDYSVQTKSMQARLVCAMVFFHSETCIRFVNKEKHHKNYLVITNSGMHCSSDSVGMKGGKQEVTLPGSANDKCWKHGTIVHELMHAAGSFHEHQRQDRDEHIEIDFEYIAPSIQRQFRTVGEMGYQNYQIIGNYDFSSIMHYGSKIGKDIAIVAKYAKYKLKSYKYTEQMGNRKQPTKMDILKVNTRYGCSNHPTVNTRTPTSTTTTTFKPDTRANELPTRIVVLLGTATPRREYIYPENPGYNKVGGYIHHSRGQASHVNDVGHVVVTGGTTVSSLQKSYAIDPFFDTASYIEQMTKNRCFHANAVVKDSAYICGGKDRYTRGAVLSSCEKLRHDEWISIAPMTTAREGLAMATLNDQVYAIGGKKRGIMNTVERYSPQSDTWARVKSMNVKRYLHSAATLQGHIYVCGGFSIPVDLTNCERYNPSTNQWSFVKEMVVPRRSFGLVADSSYLYAVGGCHSDAKRSLEMFDPIQNKWVKHKKELSYDRCGCSAVIV